MKNIIYGHMDNYGIMIVIMIWPQNATNSTSGCLWEAKCILRALWWKHQQ